MAEFSYRARRRSGETRGGHPGCDRPAGGPGANPAAWIVPHRRGNGQGGPRPARNAPVKKRIFCRSCRRHCAPSCSRSAATSCRNWRRSPTQLANLLKSGMPLTVALNSMTHLESKGIPAGGEPRLEAGGHRRPGIVGGDGEAAAYFFGFVCQHGAGRRAERFALSRFFVVWRIISANSRRCRGKVQIGVDLSSDGLLCGRGNCRLLHVFMMPKFMEIFNGFGVELPLLTKMLMGFSKFFIHYWWLLGLAVIVVIILFKRFQAER